MANADTDTASADRWQAIDHQIAAAAGPERPALRKRLKRLKRRARKGQPFERGLRRLQEAAAASA
ncbi:MAG: hypothetical protein BRD57_04435, partial [Proteobacteria bacterium SW_6_67_9]